MNELRVPRNFHEYEKNVFKSVKQAFSDAQTRDSVNKVYRQSRNWSRYHYYFANACTEERLHEMNGIFKLMRANRLSELEGGVDDDKCTDSDD